MFGYKSFLRIGPLDDASIMGLYRSSYELMDCNFGFTQAIDDDGKVQTEVVGGNISFVLPGIPSNEILQWMLNRSKLESGAIVICDLDDVPLEKIFFEDAICVNTGIDYQKKGKGYIQSHIMIQARRIAVGDVQLENRWNNL